MGTWGFNPQTIGALGTAIAALIGMIAVYGVCRQHRLSTSDRERKHANHVRVEQLPVLDASDNICAFVANIVNTGEHSVSDVELLLTLRGFCEKARIEQETLWSCEVKRNPLVSLRSYLGLGYNDLLMIANDGSANRASVSVPIPGGLFSLVRWGVAFTDVDGVRWTRFAPKPGQSIGDLRGRCFSNQAAKSTLSKALGSPR